MRTCGCQFGEAASACASYVTPDAAHRRASSSLTRPGRSAAHVSAARRPLWPSSTAQQKSAHDGVPPVDSTLSRNLSSCFLLCRCATAYDAQSPTSPDTGGGGGLDIPRPAPAGDQNGTRTQEESARCWAAGGGRTRGRTARDDSFVRPSAQILGGVPMPESGRQGPTLWLMMLRTVHAVLQSTKLGFWRVAAVRVLAVLCVPRRSRARRSVSYSGCARRQSC